MKIPFSDRKEESKYLKIKWLDTRMEEKVLTRYISLDYESQYLLSSTIMYPTWKKQYMTSLKKKTKNIDKYW